MALVTPLKYPISVFVTEPIVALPTTMPAYEAPASDKLITVVGLVVASLKNLTSPSDASRITPANLRLVVTSALPAGDTAAEVTLAFVLS